MRVQHNIAAMNSYRNYNNNTSAINKNLEKLSSGYRVNRAGDDAAGLAISEKMRAQITGLETAQKNAKDAISLVQTGEGALTEVHSMLNRMYQLAEQSANGTYDDDVDRAQLQKEVDSIRLEIQRIAENANFNGTALLDGNFTAKTFQIGDSSSETLEVSIASIQTAHLGKMKDDGSALDKSLDDVDISKQEDANKAIDIVKGAINMVSDIRGGLGAIQNRLEHTINNLSVTQENMQDAEAVIRDTDMAAEMMKYTKNNILTQASQAMLASANQQPQGVLQLLQ